MIRTMENADAAAVLAIYAQGIAGRNATFETACPDWQAWQARHHGHSRLVAERDGRVVGWAALAPVSARAAYGGVAEVSVYVDTAQGGRGIGGALLAALVAASEQNGVWSLFSSIFPENAASVRIHLNNGFRLIGRREKIAQLDGVWRDTALYERRSTSVGR